MLYHAAAKLEDARLKFLQVGDQEKVFVFMVYFTARALGLAVFVGLTIGGWELAWAQDAGSADPIVATVNGKEIRASDVSDARSRLPSEYTQIPAQVLQEMLVESLIDMKVAAAEGRRQGIHNSDQVRLELTRVEDQLIQQVLIERHLSETLTDDALKARYERMVQEEDPGEEVSARHILVATEAKAQDIIVELNAGADFAAKAQEHSIGPSKSRGGDLGFFKADEMLPAFSKAAFALEKGKMTETPVQTQYGWHIIKVDDRRAAEPPSFEEAQGQLRQTLVRELRAAYLDSLRAGVTIERYAPGGTLVSKSE